MKIIQIILSLSLLLLFGACQPESTITPNTNSGSMTIEMDGVTQTVTNFDNNNTLIKYQQQGEKGRRLDLRANIGNDMFIITVQNWDVQNPPSDGIVVKNYDVNWIPNTPLYQTCIQGNLANLCDDGLGTYTSGGIDHMSFNLPNEPLGIITISENNDADKTVSGTFDFKVQNLIQPSSTPITFTGSFSDLPYTVIE
jgi:hypothetical protein